jgi:hypothetical protein
MRATASAAVSTPTRQGIPEHTSRGHVEIHQEATTSDPKERCKATIVSCHLALTSCAYMHEQVQAQEQGQARLQTQR